MKELKPNLLVLALVSGIGFAILFGFFTGSGFSLFSGLFFGGSTAAFLKYQNSKYSNIPDEILQEGLVCHGPANHAKNSEARGGWLYLTNSHLIFKPHKINLQKEKLVISLSDIVKFGERNTLLVIPNGLFIELRSGVKENFVLGKKNEWIESLYAIVGNNNTNINFREPELSPAHAPISLAEEIQKLNKLKSDGVISDDEFQSAKKKLIG